MNIYVETNFVLELAFVQEEYESCEQIIGLCEAGSATIVLPAFCIAESYEKLIRRAKRRKQIKVLTIPILKRACRIRDVKCFLASSTATTTFNIALTALDD